MIATPRRHSEALEEQLLAPAAREVPRGVGDQRGAVECVQHPPTPLPQRQRLVSRELDHALLVDTLVGQGRALLGTEWASRLRVLRSQGRSEPDEALLRLADRPRAGGACAVLRVVELLFAGHDLRLILLDRHLEVVGYPLVQG